jgi:hypothetical protein
MSPDSIGNHARDLVSGWMLSQSLEMQQFLAQQRIIPFHA